MCLFDLKKACPMRIAARFDPYYRPSFVRLIVNGLLVAAVSAAVSCCGGTSVAATTTILTASPSSPKVTGTQVIFSALASGGSGSYRYEFQQQFPGGKWTVVQPYSSKSSWTWDTSQSPIGISYFQVLVSNVGSSAPYDASAWTSFTTYAAPATSVSFTTNIASPVKAGSQITFKGAASGGTGNYQYQFFQQINGRWVVVSPYSTSSSWTWNTAGVSPGTYYFQLYAKCASSASLYDVTGFIAYTISPPPAKAIASFVTNLKSPQIFGTQVTLTAAASGGSGNYQYEFLQQIPGGQWTVVQPYSSSPSWTWDTSKSRLGISYFEVFARSAGSTASFEASAWKSFTSYCDIDGVASAVENSAYSPYPSEFHPIVPFVASTSAIPSIQQHYASLIQADLGPMPELVPLAGSIVSSKDFPTYTQLEVTYQVQKSGDNMIDWVKAYLLIPKGYSFPRPGILALHQSVREGKAQTVGQIAGDPEYDPTMWQALDLVQAGYVVLAPDSIGAGERVLDNSSGPYDYTPFISAYPNWSVTGKMLWDHERGIDYLLAFQQNGAPIVNPKKLGVIGNSLGATNALFLAAFDARIQAVAPSCGYTRLADDPALYRYNEFIPKVFARKLAQTAPPWDYEHLLFLIYPRAIFQNFAMQDAMYPPVDFNTAIDSSDPDSPTITTLEQQSQTIKIPWKPWDPSPYPIMEVYSRLPDSYQNSKDGFFTQLSPSTSVSNVKIHLYLQQLYSDIGKSSALQTFYTQGAPGDYARGGHGFPMGLHSIIYGLFDSLFQVNQ